jgi:hypothetical protein
VVRIDFDRDLQGWRPPKGMLDKQGEPIEDRIYNLRDMDRQLVLEMRTLAVAAKITQFLKSSDPYAEDHRLLRRHRPCRAHAPGAGEPQPRTGEGEPQVRHAHHR